MTHEKMDDDVLKEKTLWQIFRASQSIPDSPFNWVAGLCTFAIFFIYSILEKDTLRIHAVLMQIAELGVSASVSILGFLIAGFTIFSTLAKPELVVLMARTKHSCGLSYLKYNHFTFVRAFIYYLAFLGFALVVQIFGTIGGPFSAFTRLLPDPEDLLYWGNRAMLTLGAAFFTFVILQLKSFVFNVYHVVMTGVRFELEADNSDEKS